MLSPSRTRARAALSPHFCFAGRRGVSELYASLLMVGVTLSLGGLVAAAAVSQFGLQSGSAAAAGGVQQASQGKLLSLVYATVQQGSGGCAAPGEGRTLTFAVYDYGSSAFLPSTVLVNSTAVAGPYPGAGPGEVATYTLALAGCARSSGQTILMGDAAGDVVQFET
jgi:flagellin-like protein